MKTAPTPASVFIPLGKGADGVDYDSVGPVLFSNEEAAFSYAVSAYRYRGYSIPAAEHRASTLADYIIYHDRKD